MLHKGRFRTINLRSIKYILFSSSIQHLHTNFLKAGNFSHAQVKKTQKPTESLEACSILILEHSRLGFPKNKILKSA